MRLFKCILFLCLSSAGFAQNPVWINKDKEMISSFIKTYRSDSLNLYGFFLEPKSFDTTQLGRNYYSVDFIKPGGYISITAKYLFYNDTVIAYKIRPQMPDEPELIDRYKLWYSELFQFNDSSEIISIYLNKDKWFEPLKEYNGNNAINDQSELFKHFFSIESGDIYGYYNGWGGLHYNRALFEKLLSELTTELIELIMYSKNPISRLQAFHYYMTHKSEFERQTEIESWMDQVLKDHPIINCADSDIIERCNPKDKLMEYVMYNLEEK